MAAIQDFGATGDGKTDDTDAIQHAVDQGDGEVTFHRGDFLITRPIEIRLNQSGRTGISGGNGTAKIINAGPGPAFRFMGTHQSTADPAGFKPVEWAKERFPIVRDIEIEGRHAKADGIEIIGVMQPTISGVLIREVNNGIRIHDRARNVIIDRCQIYHNRGVGIFLDNVNLHQTIISQSHISYCRRGGIRIENSEIRNLQITGNDIEYNNHKSHKDAEPEPTAEIYVDVGESGSIREGTIVSNTIQATYSNQGSNIRFVGNHANSQSNHRAGMWTISGNLIGSQENNIHLTAVRGITITGNYIYSGHHRNILIEKSRNIVIGPNCLGHNPDYRKNELATGIEISDSANCNISGLLIEDAEAGKHTVPGAGPFKRNALLEINRCHRVNISGTQILDPTPVGILLNDCNETMIQGCTVHDDREPIKMTTGILWRGKGNANAILNTRVGEGLQSSIEADSSVKVSGCF